MSKKIFSATVVLALVLASGWAGYYLQQRQRADRVATPASEPIKLGELAPAFSLPDLQGNMRSLSEWRGRVVVLNFWATWCPPCRDEIPVFVDLQQRYAEAGLQFVGIALHSPREWPEVRTFAAEYGMNYPILPGEMEVITLAENLGNKTGGLPYTVLLDRQGRVQFVHAGPLTREQTERLVTALL